MLVVPKCGCRERCTETETYTCPLCIAAAIRFHSGERVAQSEMFRQVDDQGSVSALSRSGGEPVHISKVLRSLADADDLPF